ncbi:hypothetical protein [Fusobacterium sp. SYSU M8D902]|uniref:toxin-antitoxin system YwqK family antitoxin n=1 Tax=Fusobacterium sp. SYSU M8D902 TaxID=3159562 RepID=UPI0032E5193B
MEEKRNGEQKTFYKNGVIRKIENYKDGEYNGEQKTFYENGAIRKIENYKDGEYDGEQKIFYENGNLEDLQKYDNNKRIGEWKEFYEDGNLKTISLYKNNNLEKQSSYNSNGELIEDFNVNYKDGMNFYIGKYLKKTNDTYKEGFYNDKGFTGILKTYYPNGNVQEIFNLEDDFYIGKYEKYYENGKLFISGEYNNNSMKDKEWKYYEENGNYLSCKIFNNGKYEKELEYYNNKLIRERNFFENKIVVNNFNNNKLESIEELYKTKDRLRIYKFPNGHINYIRTKNSWKAYYENGNLKFDYQMEETNFKGEHRNYYENGNLKNECFYSINENGYSFKSGSEFIYNESGLLIKKNIYEIDSSFEILKESLDYDDKLNVIKKSNYINNNLHSEYFYNTEITSYKEYFENGNLYAIGNLNLKSDDSKRIEFYETGEKSKEIINKKIKYYNKTGNLVALEEEKDQCINIELYDINKNVISKQKLYELDSRKINETINYNENKEISEMKLFIKSINSEENGKYFLKIENNKATQFTAITNHNIETYDHSVIKKYNELVTNKYGDLLNLKDKINTKETRGRATRGRRNSGNER